MELGQRYSVMVKLDQEPGDCYLRFATYPSGEMQQVLQDKAIISYSVSISSTYKSIKLIKFSPSKINPLRVSWRMSPEVGCC